jgi:sugar phosphate isomerase/epimerase
MRFGCCADPDVGERLAQVGYDYIELSVSRHLQPEVDGREWADLRRSIEAQPLPTEAFNTFLPSDLKITGPKVDEARVSDYLRVAFERAADIGGQLIVFGSGGARTYPEGYPPRRAWQQLLDFVQRAAEQATKADMVLCIEPLNRSESNVINGLREATQLAQQLAHPRVGAVADLYHIVREEEPMQHLIDAGHLVSHVHVADSGRRSPGLGTYPYPAFFSALHQIGYDSRCSVECRWEDIASECGPSLDFLRSMWNRTTP